VNNSKGKVMAERIAMTPEQQAAYVFSQAVAAMIEAESMKAMNAERVQNGQALAYGEEAFMELIQRYQIGHNDVISYFRSGSSV
jgi:hypothetical protein